MAKPKSITIKELNELYRRGIENVDRDAMRDRTIHHGDQEELRRAAEYRRGERSGMDKLLAATERIAK